jgi:hypothetical protein
MSYFTRPEEVLVEWRDRLDANKEKLGLQSVILGESDLLLQYPCCQIVGEPVSRDYVSTQYFQVFFQAALWIYHAALGDTHQQRTIDDMKLATQVVQFMHQPANRVLKDTNGSDRLIFSHVSSELPGQIRQQSKPSIITTRLLWIGESRVLFENS